MTDIIQIYNPANANGLTQDQIFKMQSLTSDEIKLLAKTYPNLVMQRAYLLIIDSTKPIEKQLPNLSSFENLYNLREKNGQKKWVAYGFKGAAKPKVTQIGRVTKVSRGKVEIVDLSDAELMNLPGFKMPNNVEVQPTTVEVRKIEKKPEQLKILQPTEQVKKPKTKTPNNA